MTERARLTVFGFPSSEAVARVHYRDPFWRGSRAAGFLGLGVVLAFPAALIPPHAPWALGALGVGGIMARRKWRERRTLVELEGSCPRCESPVRITRPTRMREPHSLPCEACNHEMELELLGPED